MCLGLIDAKGLLSQGLVAGSEPCVTGKLPISDLFHMSYHRPLRLLPYGGFKVMMCQDRQVPSLTPCLSTKRPHLLHLSGSAHLEDLSREAIVGS